jgi:pantoate--beta-alanine ligase
MVTDLCLPVEIVAARTVREPDGLAMSSRNRYLQPDERARAATLYEQLCAVRDGVRAGRRDYDVLCAEASAALTRAGFVPDYVQVVDSRTLRAPGAHPAALVVAGAARLGRARLIDNVDV